MIDPYDVIVIGGGPGGLYAGLRLARRGCTVALLEEHDAIGQPVHCTGILSADAFAEFDLPRGVILNELRLARFYAPSGRHIDYTTSAVEALVIDRPMFDRELARAAADAGVRMLPCSRVTAIESDARGISVTTGPRAGSGQHGTAMRARAGVLACGASYALQRRSGLGLPRAYLHSAQAEVPCERPGDVELHFGSAIAPSGFAWAVPVRRGDRWHARVGVMCDRDAPRHFDRIVERVDARWGLGAGTCQPRHKILPLAPIERTYADRLLVIGDAAGLVKATTGGGIYYSLVSAAIAADVLAEALARDALQARALRSYEREWRRRLAPELNAQLSMRRIAERLTDADIEALFELARTDGVMPIVRRTARFNQHRAVILALLKHQPARRILFRALAG